MSCQIIWRAALHSEKNGDLDFDLDLELDLDQPRPCGNTAAKRTAHEYKFKLPVNYAFPVTY